MKLRIILAAILVAIIAGAGGVGCDKKSTDTEDPIRKAARQRYNEGRRLFLTCDPNNFQAAIKAYDDALSTWNDFPEALAAWAETVSMWYGFDLPQGMFEEAYVKAQRAIRLAPENDAGYRAMADLFRHYRDPETGKLANEEAMMSIERALSIDANSAENLYVKGSILLAINPEEAIKVLQAALRRNRDLSKVYFNLASAHQILGDQVTYGPKDEDPDKQEAREIAASEHYQAAVAHLKTYNKMVPGDVGGYVSLGIIYLHAKKYEDAEAVLQKSVSVNVNPDPSQVQWRGLAYVYLAQIADQHHKDLKLSRTYLERAVEANPYDSSVYKQLIRIAEIQRDAEGVRKYEQAYQAILDKVQASQAAAEGGSTVEAGAAVPQPGATTPLPTAGSTPAPVPGLTPLPALPPPSGSTVP